MRDIRGSVNFLPPLPGFFLSCDKRGAAYRHPAGLGNDPQYRASKPCGVCIVGRWVFLLKSCSSIGQNDCLQRCLPKIQATTWKFPKADATLSFGVVL